MPNSRNLSKRDKRTRWIISYHRIRRVSTDLPLSPERAVCRHIDAFASKTPMVHDEYTGNGGHVDLFFTDPVSNGYSSRAKGHFLVYPPERARSLLEETLLALCKTR